jgi:hypothetical protein
MRVEKEKKIAATQEHKKFKARKNLVLSTLSDRKK